MNDYTQDQIALGVNVVAQYYAGWAGASGVSQAGFQAALEANDPNVLGELGSAVQNTSQSVWGPAIDTQAGLDGVSYPTTSELLGVIAQAVGNPSLTSILTGAISDTSTQAVAAAQATVAGVESAASFLTSPGFLIAGGLVVLLVGMILFAPEIKAAGKVVERVAPKEPEQKANPKRRRHRA